MDRFLASFGLYSRCYWLAWPRGEIHLQSFFIPFCPGGKCWKTHHPDRNPFWGNKSWMYKTLYPMWYCYNIVIVLSVIFWIYNIATQKLPIFYIHAKYITGKINECTLMHKVLSSKIHYWNNQVRYDYEEMYWIWKKKLLSSLFKTYFT